MNKHWWLLLVSVFASLVIAYLGWIYLSLMPLLIFAVLMILKNRSSQFSVDPSSQVQLFTEWAGLIQECEDNLKGISITQNEAVSMLNSACEKLSVLQSALEQHDADLHNEKSKNANITNIISEIIKGLQFDDINQQNLAFTNQTLSFVRGLIIDLALQSNDTFDIKVSEQLTNIHNRQKQKLNPVASKNLKEGDVDFF